MVTTTINRKPYTTTRRWSTFPDGSVDLQFGDNKNNLSLQTFKDSNITISSKYKSERTSVSVLRNAISSVEVNTKTYPIWLIIGGLILGYSLFFIGAEIETADYCSKESSEQYLYETNCDQYIPFLPQIYGMLMFLVFVIIYVITKRGRIILRVQSDADFRILVSSNAIPSQVQMRSLVDTLLFIPSQGGSGQNPSLQKSPYNNNLQPKQQYIATTLPSRGLPPPPAPNNQQRQTR